jgi:hypothetical protein
MLGKALMKTDIYTAEVYDDGELVDPEEIFGFTKGMEVEVLKEADSPNNYRQFVIYSKEIGESTTVFEGILDFIKD